MTMQLPIPAYVVSADWSKNRNKRSVHLVDVGARRMSELERDDWDLDGLLGAARRLARGGEGSVLIAMDLALGVPAGLWRAIEADPRWAECRSFLDWLAAVGKEATFFDPVEDPGVWAIDRPFFRVRKGEGGLGDFVARVNGGMLRRIDAATQAKPMFAVSGIPGTVGSGTASLWRELAPLLGQERDFAVWPFEGEERPIRLVESYPGIAYAVGVAEALPTARLRVAKTKDAVRAAYCRRLKTAVWVHEHGVDLGNLSRAKADEDVFDSLVTAAAILRCLIEGRPLCVEAWVDATAEGTMVLAGPVDPNLPSQAFRVGPAAQAGQGGGRRGRRDAAAQHACPIPGCNKVFEGGRGGWDAHVASLRFHRDWHSEITDGTARKARFRQEFPTWFD